MMIESLAQNPAYRSAPQKNMTADIPYGVSAFLIRDLRKIFAGIFIDNFCFSVLEYFQT